MRCVSSDRFFRRKHALPLPWRTPGRAPRVSVRARSLPLPSEPYALCGVLLHADPPDAPRRPRAVLDTQLLIRAFHTAGVQPVGWSGRCRTTDSISFQANRFSRNCAAPSTDQKFSVSRPCGRSCHMKSRTTSPACGPSPRSSFPAGTKWISFHRSQGQPRPRMRHRRPGGLCRDRRPPRPTASQGGALGGHAAIQIVSAAGFLRILHD